MLLLRASGNALEIARGLIWQSLPAIYAGDSAIAEAVLNEALTLASASDEPGAIAHRASALSNLGIVATMRGDFDLAESRLTEALQLRDAHGFDLAAPTSLISLAEVAYQRGDYPLALARFGESLARFGERGPNHSMGALAGVAASAAALGLAPDAARLYGASRTVLERAGIPAMEPATQAAIDRDLAALRCTLGEEAFEHAWAEGRALSWSALMEEVMALCTAAPGEPLPRTTSAS